MSFILLACAVAVSGPVLAAPPGPDALPIAVVAAKSDDALDQAEALTQALRKAVRDADGWSLGAKTKSLEFLALQMKCSEPIDAACEARIADVIKADRYLWSVIAFSDKSNTAVHGTLNFFVRGQGTNRVELDYSANLTDPNEEALVEVARKAIVEATGGAPKGVLKVSTGGVAGQIFVDDNPLGALPAEGSSLQLSAGEHRIVVKAPGYADAEATVTVRPATTVEATVTMIEQEASAPLDWRMIGGFAAIGVGAVAGAIGLWQALEVNSIQTGAVWTDVHDNVPANLNVCEIAASPEPTTVMRDTDKPAIVDACDTASTAEILQAIMFPLAAVSAGVGAYLLGTSSLVGGAEEDEDTQVEALAVAPVIGPRVQAIRITYRF